jgi:hypothetical protein
MLTDSFHPDDGGDMFLKTSVLAKAQKMAFFIVNP